MIPRTIHYCWFGGSALPELAVRCLASWREQMPDWEVKRWDESNFDVQSIPYTREAYCLGHMLEGAIAYARATGKDKWLKTAVRALEQMMRVNGPEGQHWVTGHQELELAL